MTTQLEDLARKAAEEIYKSDDFLRDIPLRHRPNMEAAILSALQSAVAERDVELAALRSKLEGDALWKLSMEYKAELAALREKLTVAENRWELLANEHFHCLEDGTAIREIARNALATIRATQPIGGKPFPPNYGGG